MHFGEPLRHAAWRRAVRPLARTPFHPQFLLLRRAESRLRQAAAELSGVVLDVGCAAKRILPFLPPRCRYLGLDTLQTGAAWYGAHPEVFADAAALPVADGTIDHVLALDVLEHLPDPEASLREMARVLRWGGSIVVQVPFLYPLHDLPWDFRRWTPLGLERFAASCGLETRQVEELTSPVECGALLLSLALANTGLQAARRSWLWLPVLPILGLAIFAVNVMGWIGSWSRTPGFMTAGYRLRLVASRAHANSSENASTTS